MWAGSEPAGLIETCRAFSEMKLQSSFKNDSADKLNIKCDSTKRRDMRLTPPILFVAVICDTICS